MALHGHTLHVHADVSLRNCSFTHSVTQYLIITFMINAIGVPDRGAEGAVAPLGFGKLVKFGQMGWEIRAFRGLNFSR